MFILCTFYFFDQTSATPTLTEQSGQNSLELDLEHYEVPPPENSANHGVQYAADAAEAPRGSLLRSVSVPVPFYGESRKYKQRQGIITELTGIEPNEKPRDRSVSIKVFTLVKNMHMCVY